MNFKKLYKLFPYLYAFFALFVFLFIRDVLNNNDITIKKTEKKEKIVEDVKPVKVTLIIQGIGSNKVYERRLNNNDTFDDLLEELRDENLVFYEKTEYIYGTEYEQLYGVEIPDESVWKVYAGGEDITFKTNGVLLNDGWVYRLVLSER